MSEARTYARTCGVVYVLIFATAIPGELLVMGRLIVEGNPTATVAKILASQQLWRAGYSAEMLTMIFDVVIAWLLYVLLAPANRKLALLAAFFRLTYVAIYAPAVIANVAALPLAQQHLVTAVDFALHVHNEAFALSLIFFGANLAIAGFLIGCVPIGVRWLSMALEAAGAAYIVNSFALFLAPSVQAVFYPWILLLPFVGEIGLTLWLLFTRRFDGVQSQGA